MAEDEAKTVELFEHWTKCTLPAKDWTHSAHVSVCSYLAWHHGLARCYSLMKSGLYRFNEATGVPNNEERGYHETLTRFWVTMLFFKIHRGHYSSVSAAIETMVSLYGMHSRAERPYYSFDVLKNREARRFWVAPDLNGDIPREAFHW